MNDEYFLKNLVIKKYRCSVCGAINSPEIPNMKIDEGTDWRIRLCSKHHDELNVNRTITMSDKYTTLTVVGHDEDTYYLLGYVPQEPRQLKF